MASATTNTIIRTMITANPYKSYEKVKVTSASKENLVIMAYEGAIKFISHSIREIKEGKFEKAHFNLVKAQAIINELMKSLNFEKGGEISVNLYNLYEYMNYNLILGNIKKDKQLLEEVKGMLNELIGAWREVKKGSSSEKNGNK